MLPKKPMKEPKEATVTFRISKSLRERLKELATSHNLSQAAVIEHLILTEYDRYRGANKVTKKREGEKG